MKIEIKNVEEMFSAMIVAEREDIDVLVDKLYGGACISYNKNVEDEEYLREIYGSGDESIDELRDMVSLDDYLPMNGMVYKLPESLEWVVRNHIDEVIDMGFDVWVEEDLYGDETVFLTINGIGYSFIDNHFKPLYELMASKL